MCRSLPQGISQKRKDDFIMTKREERIISNNPAECSLQVHIATQSWEKRAIYRLRYEVYVEEMARSLGSHANTDKLLFDSLDDKSILLYAQAGSDIIGTMRLTIAAVEDFSAELVKVFHMHKFKALYTDNSNPLLSLGTKLAITPRYRNSPALFLLIAKAYQILRDQSVHFFFGGCNPNMIPLYERIGFRRFVENFTDPGYGLLIPLVAIPADTPHFRAVKSPLYRSARKNTSDSTMAQRFLQAFPEAANHINTQLVSRESLWEYVQKQLGISPCATPALANLDRESITDLLVAGAIFHCSPGDCILSPDDLSTDLYILVSGILLSKSQTGSETLQPGNYFGGANLTESQQLVSVSSLTNSEVFVLSHQAFTRYQHLHPQAAAILLNNLARTQDFAYACATLTEQGGQQHE